MKKIIKGLKDNRQVYVFAVIGIILVLFPKEMGTAAPYLLGIAALAYGAVNIVISLKYPDSDVSLGGGIIIIVAGVIPLVMREDSVSIIGVIWAMLSLFEAAKEIDEYRREGKVRAVSLISVIVSIGLAVLLLTDPFKHFVTHVRILGLEIIAASFVRWKENRKTTEVKE